MTPLMPEHSRIIRAAEKTALIAEAAELRRPAPCTTRQLSPEEAEEYPPEHPTKAELLAALEAGESVDDVAQQYGRTIADIQTRCKTYKLYLLSRHRSVARAQVPPAAPASGRPHQRLPATSEEFYQLMADHPDWTGTLLAAAYGWWGEDEDRFWSRLYKRGLRAAAWRAEQHLPSFQTLRARHSVGATKEGPRVEMMTCPDSGAIESLPAPNRTWRYEHTLTVAELAELIAGLQRTLRADAKVNVMISVVLL